MKPASSSGAQASVPVPGASSPAPALLKSELMLASESGDTDVVRDLLREKGVRVNAVDAAGDTALLLACRECNHDSAWVLLKAGADINARNVASPPETPFSLSRSKAYGYEELGEHGAAIALHFVQSSAGAKHLMPLLPSQMHPQGLRTSSESTCLTKSTATATI